MAGDKYQDGNKPAYRKGGRQKKEDLSNFVFGKVQPQAVPLEEAVLGAIMLDKEALTVVLDILRAESFYLDAHQLIYKAMMRLFEKSQPVDLLTVTEELKKTSDLEAAGGPYYLIELTNKVASAANIEYHARIIAQKFVQRELITVSTKIITDAYEDSTDVFELLDDAEQGLFSIAQQNMSRGVESMSSLAAKAQKQMEELRKKEDGLTGVPSGFTDLDRLTSGLQRSDLIILAARPGMGKCLGKGTKVLMYDGSLKKVEDVVPGDLLMGDDSTPRRVLTIARGREQMYWIRQNKGKDYRVNESHILSLKKSRQEGKGEHGSILDISVRDYLAMSAKFQSNYKGYKVAVDFPEQAVPLPPYFLGLWLGDGSSYKSNIINQDEEVVAYLEELAQAKGLELVTYKQEGKCPEHRISNRAEGRHGYSIQGVLREMELLQNKHIPQAYLINSRQKRLELLAGLIDSDGHYLVQSNGYEITQKNEALARQIKFLCDSLGYRVSFKPKQAVISSIGYESTVYRLRIYGNLDEVPVKVKRKQANPWKSLINWQVTGIQVEYDKVDDYYGFEIDGNRRFLLEDMTVTHNTAFTLSLARNAAMTFKKAVAFFSLEMSALQLAQRIIAMEAEISGMKMRNGQLEDYEWEQLNAALERVSEVPIYIDDTPGINVFELRAKCRRLKMQHDIDLIVIDYLQLMSGGGDNQRGNREQEVSAISRALKGLAKELNVPVIALSQLSRAVETRGGSKRPQLSDLRESGCLTGDTILQDADTGRLMTIKELAERKEQSPVKVLAMSDDYKIGAHTLTRAFYSGRKMTYELTTRSGRTIKASANHPFRKLEGWTALEDLNPGDRIAVTWSYLDIFWDEIKSITPLKEEDVYDATIEGVHNFVANDIIVHNSIEQDADIVAFIYRPEYYDILEDEEGMSLKNVAELIVAKHRHGALETVRMRFEAEFARFSDLDDPDFGDLPGDTFGDPQAPNIITRPSKMNDDEDIPF
ncbi:MAG: replicative DNA helicase [Phaeodactylibacter xiamenensis]|uniref:replicative DNA helicase n=1 Tax=Phaeodactylibacter xiamenensis TaxID=1524460 RepID=UPI0009DE7363|nr:replicative DNA helicase [Phaeodactylibacter xiamenensis]MCR9052074.1 replicative DNA helicase [bacterium]